MPLRPSIPLIDNVLGGSVIYEEYKGEFPQARRIADAALNDTRERQKKVKMSSSVAEHNRRSRYGE